MLVEHDLMAARHGPLAQLLPHPGDRLAAFAQWFEQTVNTQLLGGRWWERFLERAYSSGFAAGSRLARVPPSPTPLPAVFRELASQEFAGIAAALVQQVSRQAAGAALGRRKPQPMYRQVLPVLHVGHARVRAAINTLTVKVHNSGRLAQFRAAGIERVGIEPERLEPRKPSRFLKHARAVHDHIHRDKAAPDEDTDVLTAGDDLVCEECLSIADDGPYTMDEAEILIPAHPNCRCALVPFGEYTKEELTGESSEGEEEEEYTREELLAEAEAETKKKVA
jgi:hypothetical protein